MIEEETCTLDNSREYNNVSRQPGEGVYEQGYDGPTYCTGKARLGRIPSIERPGHGAIRRPRLARRERSRISSEPTQSRS
jgi:hypothetical protein